MSYMQCLRYMKNHLVYKCEYTISHCLPHLKRVCQLIMCSSRGEACAVVHRRGGGGVTLASWSPNAKCLFTATPSSVFRVWETKVGNLNM